MGLTFNNISSDSIGVIVDGYYSKSAPARRVTETVIPGRNGSLLKDEGVYKNIQIEYDLYWLPEDTTDEVVTDWLRQDGYYKLVDSDNPSYYRMAQVSSGVQITNHRDCYHSTRVTFNCKPQLYLISGDTSVYVPSGGSISNPTQQDSLPLILVVCDALSEGSVTVAGKTLTVSAENSATQMIVDCDSQNSYYDATNLNLVVSGDYPVLKPGANQVLYTGCIRTVMIIPRWWTV